MFLLEAMAWENFFRLLLVIPSVYIFIISYRNVIAYTLAFMNVLMLSLILINCIGTTQHYWGVSNEIQSKSKNLARPSSSKNKRRKKGKQKFFPGIKLF